MKITINKIDTNIHHWISHSNTSHNIFDCVFCKQQRSKWYFGEYMAHKLASQVTTVPLNSYQVCQRCKLPTTEIYVIKDLPPRFTCAYCTQNIILHACAKSVADIYPECN